MTPGAAPPPGDRSASTRPSPQPQSAALRRTRSHRLFAALYDRHAQHEPAAQQELRRFLAGGAQGRSLEVGCGPAVNAPYYPPGADVTLTDPDPAMLRRARRHLDRLGLAYPLHPAAAEALPFPDATFDTAVCTLTLCSVADPAASLAEIRRVLRPDGELRLLEHVRDKGWKGALLDLLTPIWGVFAGGCHPNRRTAQTVTAAGFTWIEQRALRLPGGLPAIMGVARPAALNAEVTR